MILWDIVDTVLFLMVIFLIGQLFAAFIFSEDFRNTAIAFLSKAFIIGLFAIPLLLFGYYNVNYIMDHMFESELYGVVPTLDPYFIRLDLLFYSGIGLVISLILDRINCKLIKSKEVRNI